MLLHVCLMLCLILQAIKDRFSAILDSKDALIAAVTLPRFKVRWLKDETRRDAARRLLISECRARIPEEEQVRPAEAPPGPSSQNDFFAFEEEEQTSYTADTEVMEYLKSPKTDMEVLRQFPRIKDISRQYNTPTPSSAPVERLFSQGGIVLTPRRNRLSDRKFESILLMRYNHCFTRENEK